MNSSRNKISWPQFSSMNDDKTASFEDLCRLLFNQQFFKDSKNFVSKPNHPGVEIFPVFEKNSRKWISFQSKFFTSKINYTDIKESVEKAIEHHPNDLDIYYLYCNKDISIDSKGYQNCKNLLNDAGIEIEIIANNAILDNVIKNPRLGEYFFGQKFLDDDWFKEQLEQSLDSMGTRYNSLFNISTETEKNFKLFLKNSETLKIIEEKKDKVISELKNLRNYLREESKLLAEDIIDRIQSYKIQQISEIEKCLTWKEDIQSSFAEKFDLISIEIKEIKETKTDDEHKKQENRTKLYHLKRLINIPLLIEFSKLEQNLITEKILIIDGEAGMGKSQMLSNAANNIIKSGGHAILLPGHVFISTEPVKKQILSYLGLNIEFSAFLDILETLGELTNEKVYIFVDAINESNNRDIWKIGLPIIFREIEKLDFVEIAVSLRSGYEKLVLDHNITQKIEDNKISKIKHYGFKSNNIDAICEFLNHYNIPFSPSYLLQSEMNNPLFLTMFCKSYDGNEFDLYDIFEKFLKVSDLEAQKFSGLPGDKLILNSLIKEIAEFHLEKEIYMISEHELLELKFWNRYGLATNKLSYLSSLTKSGVLLNLIIDNAEVYRFGYNILEDFLYAKVIIDKFSSIDDCKNYLRNKVLKISGNGQMSWKYSNTFIVATNLFFNKFGEECIALIDDIRNESDREHLLNDYVKTFSWRPSQNMDSNYFLSFINENKIDPDIVFNILIENSVKEDNPLNAEFLHEILIKKPLNERDFLWTIYINGLGSEDERVFQLVKAIDEGKKVNHSHKKIG